MSIVSDKDLRFTAHFWKSFQKAMRAQLTMSTAFDPQTNGQLEMTIKILEDMLRACILDLKGIWEKHLPLLDSPITTDIRQVYRWNPMRPYMGGHVDPRFVG